MHRATSSDKTTSRGGIVAALTVVFVIGVVTAAQAAVSVKREPTASFSGASVTVSGGKLQWSGQRSGVCEPDCDGACDVRVPEPTGSHVAGPEPCGRGRRDRPGR